MALGPRVQDSLLCIQPAKLQEEKDLLDDAYVGGILHDMGKIIFANVHPDLLDKISNFCVQKGLKKDFIEALSAGLNHAEIGGMVAEKWNFPSSLVESIKFHHEPTSCSKENIDVVYTVYLANAICNIEEDLLTYEQVDAEVLKAFGITSEKQLATIREKLSLLSRQTGKGNSLLGQAFNASVLVW